MKTHARRFLRTLLSWLVVWPLLARADALSQWGNRSFPNASGSSYSLSGVVFGSNVFVAVGQSGDFGIILSSPDGTTWTPRHPANLAFDTLSVNGIAYGTNRFVAVGKNGGLATSGDGLNWFYNQVTNSVIEFSGVTYGGGLFVAVGNGIPLAQTNIAISTDGLKWNEKRGVLNPLTRVAYGNAEYVAVGDGGIVRSAAGATWTSVNTAAFYDVAFGNGVFVISGPTGLSARLAGGPTLVTNSAARALTFCRCCRGWQFHPDQHERDKLDGALDHAAARLGTVSVGVWGRDLCRGGFSKSSGPIRRRRRVGPRQRPRPSPGQGSHGPHLQAGRPRRLSRQRAVAQSDQPRPDQLAATLDRPAGRGADPAILPDVLTALMQRPTIPTQQ